MQHKEFAQGEQELFISVACALQNVDFGSSASGSSE
jgi:hypothetical protein